MKIRYHAFVDESGQREYGVAADKYFEVTGTVVRTARRDTYETEFNGLKRAYFGTTDVEIKSNWLRQPRERKKRYCDPYGINEDQMAEFVDATYRWINATDLVFIAGVGKMPAKAHHKWLAK
jgi:nucleoside-triphosphatase THEP1